MTIYLRYKDANRNTPQNEKVAYPDSDIPTVWKILLANCYPVKLKLFAYQQEEHVYIAADVDQAMLNLKSLSLGLRQHPKFANLKWLALYLDAIEQYLQMRFTDWADRHGEIPIMLTDNFLGSETVEHFARQCQTYFQVMQDLIVSKQYDALSAHLNVTFPNKQKSDDWNLWLKWCDNFGICAFDHPYFDELEPVKLAFKDFEDSDDGWFSGDVFVQEDLFGYRTTMHKVIVPPIYQAIETAGVMVPLAKVKLNDKWGFINTKGQIEIPISYDLVGDFLPSVNLAEVKQNNFWGVVNRQGEWVIAPSWDSVLAIDEGVYFCVEKDKQYGVYDSNGKEILAPTLPSYVMGGSTYNSQFYFYNTTDDDYGPKKYYFSDWRPMQLPEGSIIYHSDGFGNYIIAKNGEQLFGLLNSKNEMLSIAFDEIIFDQDSKLFIPVHNGKGGLYHPIDGWLLPCEYEQFLNPIEEHGDGSFGDITVISHANKYGVYHHVKQCWLVPCEYEEIKTFPQKIFGVFYPQGHAKAGWWVHDNETGKEISGPHTSIENENNVYGSDTGFATYR